MAKAPSVADILAALGERAPFEKAAGWDPVGLQVGDPGAPVRALAVCHEVTEAVVAAVEAGGVDLLVSYHPLLFRPVTRLVAGPTAAGRALRLVRTGTALAVSHTNFDVVPGGAADALAEALGLTDTEGFGPLHGADAIKVATFVPEDAADRVLEAVAAAGAGRVGNYTHCSYRTSGTGTFFAGGGTAPVVGESGALNREPEVRIEFPAPRAREAAVLAALVAAHPYEEPAYDVYDRRGDAGLVGRIGRVDQGTTLASFAATVRAALGAPALRVAGDPERRLARVAVLPGSGADFLALAAECGADAVVTGDLTHHRAREALDRGTCLLDPGHIATERPGLARLRQWAVAAAAGPVVRVDLDAALDPDPWHG